MPDSGDGYTVRMAEPRDLPGARALMLRIFEEDYGYGYQPQYHSDVDDLQGTYLDHPRQVLFVAVDDATGDVLSTACVRADGPKAPPHPVELAERYAHPGVAQLVRVATAREHRRRGIARRVLDATRQWVADQGSFTVIYLHTNTTVDGAEGFWRSVGTEVWDAREFDPQWSAVHFEVPIPLARRQA